MPIKFINSEPSCSVTVELGEDQVSLPEVCDAFLRFLYAATYVNDVEIQIKAGEELIVLRGKNPVDETYQEVPSVQE